MKKIKIDLDMVLPDVPNERDACVRRIINELAGKRGIEAVHVVPQANGRPAQLCFHYQPATIKVATVQELAARAGARITDRYHHLVIEVKGIRHQRQTRLVEASFRKHKGILSADVSGSGVMTIEYDTQLIGEDEVRNLIRKDGLRTGEAVVNAGEQAGQKHEHRHDHNDDHDHSHGGILGKATELIFSIICGALLAAGFGLSFITGLSSLVPLTLYIGAYFFGGFYTAKEAVQAIRHGGFEIDFLMLVAAIGAAILGDWAEGALLLFLFSLGHALEHYAMEKAKKSIAALTDLAPKTALLKEDGQAREVPITQLKKGDVIVVRPNTKIAADGVVVAGTSSVNQAPITGESIPVDKRAVVDRAILEADLPGVDDKHRVFAGTINGNGSLEIRVAKEAKDSTLSRLIELVNEAQTQKSPTQQFTDKFERYFVPAVLALIVFLCFAWVVLDETFAQSFYRAMAVLVAASPCALAISTPSAVLSGVARAAKAGVLIKGGKPLEDLGMLTAIAFDKTGTLTEGKPKLTEVISIAEMSEEDLLKAAVAVESLSDHPIAKAIVRDGKLRLTNTQIPVADDLQAVLGKGIKASIGSDSIYIGNLSLFDSFDGKKPGEAIRNRVHELEDAGNTTMLVRRNSDYVGLIAVMDTPRDGSKETFGQLQKVGIRRMIMLTGDNQKVAGAVAAQIGISDSDAWGGLLPEQKVEAIRKLREQETDVAMVGDGVNDAPAMAASTVGIAMGAAGSDVALETADIALMGDKLTLLPFAIGLSREARRVIKQNLIISLGMVAILIPLTISGVATIGPAVIAHEGSTLVVVLNALRLLKYKR